MDFQNSMDIFNIISAVVTIATAITMITPTTADNIILDKILKVLNVFAGNILKNKNLDDKK